MVRYLFITALFAALASATTTRASDSKGSEKKTFDFPAAGEARLVNADELQEMLKSHGQKLLVVNFWATWCAPCVKELPEFVEVSNEYKDKGVLFVGLSTDFVSSWKQSVPPFLKKHKIPYPNLVVDVDPNEMIPQFSKDWGGTIPVTFFYDAEGNKVAEQLKPLSKKQLKAVIDKQLAATGDKTEGNS